MSLTEHTEFMERKQKEQSVGFIRLRRIKPTSFSVNSVSSSELGERVRNASASGLPRSPSRRYGEHGFSLVEISLALMVVGIGMLTILSMFPAGLDQNYRSISDTHAALFAEEVFSSLRVHAETNWQGIGNNIVSLRVAGADNWYEPAGPTNWLDNTIRTNIYRHPGNPDMVDHVFRYRITLTTNGWIKAATLRFWMGEYGTTNNPTMFYAEFYQMNR